MCFGLFSEAVEVVMKVGKRREVQKLLHLGYMKKILGDAIGFKK